MSICDKINEVGKTLQENLNNRGVDCTFGTGTGESTVLEMVEMVNGANFKGLSDVNLKIGANRPYLLTGETTDVVVRLEDGLCEPLKNKNVTIEQSVFRDGGVTGNHNDTWYRNGGTDNMTVTATGTTLANTTSTRYDIFAYYGIGNQIYVFQQPFTVEVDIIDYTISGSNRAKLQLYDKDTNVQYNVIDGNGHYKIVCDGTTCTTYKDGVKVNEELKNIQTARVGFTIQTDCSITYKNFVIYENITGVTDEKGEFALYDVSVTDNTILTANYGTVNSNEVTVYHCIYRDYAISNNKSNYYINGSGGTSLTWSNGYYVLGLGAYSNYVDLKSITDDVKGKPVNFRVDVVLNGASIRLRVFNESTVLASSDYTTSDGTVKVENVAIPSDATQIMFRIERRYLTDGDSIKFKNFVIY